ncbi:MAG: hypothetical protein HC875_35875 [Anaerolineales bacterium]|nr:hypothetical protein [Anaerolineales bacterium]
MVHAGDSLTGSLLAGLGSLEIDLHKLGHLVGLGSDLLDERFDGLTGSFGFGDGLGLGLGPGSNNLD